MLLGESGTGKSTSVKTLDPKETVVINVLKKRLPFKGSASLYNKENMNLFEVDEHTQVVSLLNSIDKNAPHVRNIIIDDMIYIMRKEFFKRAKETGYGKFTIMAKNYEEMLRYIQEETDPNVIVYVLQHIDKDEDGKVKAKTLGKMLDQQLTVEGLFSIVLLAQTDGKRHYFITQSDGTNPCKSPMEMFDDIEIDNDLKMVDDAIREYYGLDRNITKKKAVTKNN